MVKSHTHTINGTTENVSNSGSTWEHNHGIDCYYGNLSTDPENWAYRLSQGAGTEHNYVGIKYVNNADLQHTHPFSGTALSNDSSATENRPMSYTIRVWKRTA